MPLKVQKVNRSVPKRLQIITDTGGVIPACMGSTLRRTCRRGIQRCTIPCPLRWCHAWYITLSRVRSVYLPLAAWYHAEAYYGAGAMKRTDRDRPCRKAYTKHVCWGDKIDVTPISLVFMRVLGHFCPPFYKCSLTHFASISICI